MRRVVVHLLVSLALLLSGTALAWAAAPVIERVEVDRGRDVSREGVISYHERIWVTVSDGDGVADVSAVTVTDTEGNAHAVTSAGGPGLEWRIETPNTVSVKWEDWSTSTPPPPGYYAIAVADIAGHPDSLTTETVGPVAEVSHRLITPAPNDSLVHESTPMFSWVPASSGVASFLQVWEEAKSPGSLWDRTTLAASAVYNEDGTARQAELAAGQTYEWHIVQWLREDTGADLRVTIYLMPHASGRFTVYSPNPAVRGLNVDRGRDTSAEGTVSYHERIGIHVSDCDGHTDIASITVTDTEGAVHEVTSRWPETPYELSAEWGDWDTVAPPPDGEYTITVTDWEGHSDSVTAHAPAMREATPVLTYPDPNNSMILEVIPTFVWQDDLAGGCYRFVVSDSAMGSNVWECWPSGVTSLIYNQDGGATQLELTPGHTYDVELIHQYPEDPCTTDPRVCVRTYAHQFGRFTVYSPSPVIQNLQLDRGQNASVEGAVSYYERVRAWVTDCDWATHISSVTVVDSDGEPHLAAEMGEGPGPFAARFEWSKWDLPDPPAPGPYTVTVTDKAGYSDSLTTAVAPPVLPVSPILLTPPADNAVIYDTKPTFSWTPVVPTARNRLVVSQGGNITWEYEAGSATSVIYNADGAAEQPELIPGQSYDLELITWYFDDAGATNPRVQIRTYPHSFGRFTVYSPDPVIGQILVRRNHNIDETTGLDEYFECGEVSVVDTDGWDDVSVSIVDPMGEVRPASGDCTDATSNDGRYTVSYRWRGVVNDPTALASGAGSYTITATDSQGASTSVTTAEGPAIPPVQQMISPANGSVISEIQPTFSWEPVAGAHWYGIGLEEAGHNSPQVWCVCLPGSEAASIAYNFDGSARDTELTPGSKYRLTVKVFSPKTSDGLVVSVTRRTIEFWVAPKPEPVSFPGTMLLTRCCPQWEVYFVSGDSSQLTPAPANIGLNGDLSRDGQKVAHIRDGSLYTCNVDGSGEVLLSQAGCGTPRWSPDGGRIAFTAPTPDDPADPGCGGGEVFVVNADGSGLVRVTQVPGPDSVHGWSADGQFLLWEHRLPGGYTTWVGRPDGTDGHVIVGPGLPTNGDSALWSPDGKRLALQYVAYGPGGETLCTLGTVAPDGSDPQPLFQHQACEGGLQPPWWWGFYPSAWSPDSTQLAFKSAMQVIPDTGSATDFEIYLIDVDGTDLRRFTYDFIANSVAWIGPNTPTGPASTTISDTTITFEDVITPGVTTATVYDTPPAPEPQGFQAVGQYYNISTTAQISGTITIQIHYEDSEVPAGMEQWLSLLHWEGGHWVDVTVRPIDTVNNIITGECTSLSPFAVVLPTVKPDWQPPLRNGTSADSPAGPYKRGSTIPVKFRLLDAAGQPVSDAMAQAMVAQMQVFYEKPNAQGTPTDLGDSPPDIDGVFRYQDGVFHYNLSTKHEDWVVNFTYGLDLLINGVKAGEVFFSLR